MKLLALLALIAGGCVLPVKRVNRAALVPHMVPIQASGAALEQPVELRFGATSVTHLRAPAASDPDAAVEVPGTQVQGGVRVRIFNLGTLGFVHERGLDSTAQPGKPTQVPVDHGDVTGSGVTFTASWPIQGRWSLGFATELMVWSVPWVEYAVCVENCEGQPLRGMTEGSDGIGQFGLGLTPTYRGDGVTWFGGVTLRNHPTIEQKDQELGAPDRTTGDVEGGPTNVVLSAGAEVELGLGVRASVIAYAPIKATPLDYGPGLSAGLIIPLGVRTIAAVAQQ